MFYGCNGVSYIGPVLWEVMICGDAEFCGLSVGETGRVGCLFALPRLSADESFRVECGF